MMPGIPRFRKESHPERARDQRRPIFSHLLKGYLRLTDSIECGTTKIR
jgi:hypothetical protein